MNSQVTGLRVASVVFGLMAIAQSLRLVIRPEVVVAGNLMPLWPSVLALIFLSGLSVWMWRLAGTPANERDLPNKPLQQPTRAVGPNGQAGAGESGPRG